MKKCIKCELEQQDDNFGLHSKSKVPLNVCKTCIRIWRREYYHKNKDKASARSHRYSQKRTDNMREIKIHYGCQGCGEREACCLDFHHIDENTKIDTVSRMAWGQNRQAVADEINKCIVICANCHRKYHNGLIEINGQQCDVVVIDNRLTIQSR